MFLNETRHAINVEDASCDAQRPCSTCVRSHSYAVAHAPAGVELPPHPECTFDEVSESPPVETTETPKSRFERLESRINELESLLREKDRALNTFASDQSQPQMQHHPFASSSNAHTPNLVHSNGFNFDGIPGFANGNGNGIPTNGISNMYPNYTSSKPQNGTNGMDYTQFPNASGLDNLAGVASLLGNAPLSEAHIDSVSAGLNQDTSMSGGFQSNGSNLDIVFASWPVNLPSREVTRHLVEAYFAFHLHAVRLFHGPSFLASLDLHPTDPRFPWSAILHAMCAIGSLYVASIPPTPAPPPEYPAHEVFGARLRTLQRRPDSFAEQQAKFAKEQAEIALDLGHHKFQCVQVTVMLTWFYWCHGRWSEAFLSAAQGLRVAVPCGLNVCPPFHTIAETLRPPAIIPPAKTVMEDEVRRNTFWLAYAMERQMGTGNGWALSLDDQDICQLLPLRGDQFEQGILVYPSERQWSHDRDLLTTHKDEQIDSFILYVKATIILSRVKSFNLRFKGKHYVGDASVVSPNNSPASADQQEIFDIKDAPAFQELDKMINAFRTSFPAHLKSPIIGQSVDPYLYTASLIPHLYVSIRSIRDHCLIKPGEATCVHADRILRAARAIVDLMYNIASTSYDVSLLGLHSIMCWFMSGRVLIRFLKAAMQANSDAQIPQLQAEIVFIRSMLMKAAERITLAQRYQRMLDEYLFNSTGQTFADSLPISRFSTECTISLEEDSTSTMVPDTSRATDVFMQYRAPPIPARPTRR
ncbi:unnamed protein product [Somion occarium]|uniref:Xylanolytic transcriptional activator regulatory domain-containing protein n=1 Tax=Somion occarium TaxID=3059160 RepID=A0ABP1CI00_9APHY